jgi:hypothetical protein
VSTTEERVDPEVWAQAVREHQRCLAEWDALPADVAPGTTFHGADAHLPREAS